MDKATAAADSFDKSMDAAGNSAKEAGDKAADSESGFSKLSSTLGTGLVKSAEAGIQAFEAYTAAVAGLATAVASFSLSTYADFESQMSTVKALMSGSCDSTEELDTAMDSLTEKAQELGSTTAFTSTEVGEAMDTPNRVWILFEVRGVLCLDLTTVIYGNGRLVSG